MKKYIIFWMLFLFPLAGFAATSIPLTINTSEAVNVTGTPRIAVDVGGTTRYATYTSGSGTNALTFTYTMVAGDVDLDGVTLSSPIQLNGGTIKDVNGNDATLTFTVPNTSNVKVNYPSLGMDFVADADGRYTLNGTVYNDLSSFLTAAGGTFTRASTATYFDSTGTLQTAASGAPRFDYDPATHAAKGILIEESRTNSFLYSQQLSNPSWTARNVTVTPNSAISPDGTNNAFLYTASGQYASTYTTTTISVSSSTNYTISAFLKAGSLSTAVLVIQGANHVYGTYSLTGAGSALVNGSGYTSMAASISNLGNSWYRCSLSFTTPSSGVTAITPEIWVGNYNGTNNNGQTIYAWGAQLEQGAFATSYIPTTAAAATRSADIINIPTSSWMNTTQGTFYSEWNIDKYNGAYARVITTSDFGQNIPIAINNSKLAMNDNGTWRNATSNPVNDAGSINKTATTYSSSTANYSANGNIGSTPYAGTLSGSSIRLFYDPNFLGESSTGHFQKLKYYPSRINNTQLQLLTQ